MAQISVALEIPKEIMEGLRSGKYIREAPGIIRWAKGTENAGKIFAHLREATGELSNTLGQKILLSVGAVAAIQVAGFVYLGYELKKVRQAIQTLHHDVGNILNTVEIIHQTQWIEKLQCIFHGIELLNQTTVNLGFLEEAQKSFTKGRGEISQFILHQNPIKLVEYLPQMEELVKGMGICFAGEYYIFQKRKADIEEIYHSIDRYNELFADIKNKLEQIPPVTHRLPSLKQLENTKKLKTFLAQISATINYIQEEKSFMSALSCADREEILPLENNNSTFLILYPH